MDRRSYVRVAVATSEYDMGPQADPGEVAALLARMRSELAERDAKLAERDAKLAERDAKLAAHEARYGALKEAYQKLQLELKLLKRRLFIAKAERVDTTQLQLEFEALTEKLNALAGLDGNGDGDGEACGADDGAQAKSDPGAPSDKPRKRKPSGRRSLEGMDLPVEDVEVTDAEMEALLEQGQAHRVGVKTSYKLARRPAQYVKVAIHRVTYGVKPDADGQSEIYTADMPPELLPRGLAAPSLLANVIADKFHKGLPLYRQEEVFRHEGMPLDRGTLCRWVDQLGWALSPVTDAMDKDAREHAFLIATDATGFSVQPGPREGKARRACTKGHYFVRIADREHILFDYTQRHRSVDVQALFKGYSGVVQADACSVYNALFRPAKPGEPDDGCVRTEAGCWAHGRRKFFEAAFAKEALGREGLVRIAKVFDVESQICRKGRPPPSAIKKRRLKHMAPLIDDLVAWADKEYQRERNRRGPARAALGYIVRQQDALRAVLHDGRIRLTNNWSERELRKVVRIRDAAFFAGSDSHAQSAAAHLSLIASAKLHGLDPLTYLRDLIRVLPFWPQGRELELAPLFWAQTRARLDPEELATEAGWITVPAKPLDIAHARKQPPA